MRVRLNDEWNKAGGYAKRQYGFREKRSTVDALMAVREYARKARAGNRIAILVLLDVKNAFNTVRWVDILKALMAKGLPKYLVEMVASYLSDRIIVHEGQGAPLAYPVHVGVPQGSVIGPFLWNVVYDEIVRRHDDERVRFLAFADDLAMLISAADNTVMWQRG